LPWAETDDYIRSGHGKTEDYDKDSMRTIEIDADKGIKAIVGCPKGNFKDGKCAVGTQVLSYLFAKDNGWKMTAAKEWFEKSEKQKEEKPTKKAKAVKKKN
jgi:hypothetical protein